MQLSRITCASRADNDAPAATSAETAEAWPIRAAESNGVSPPAVFASRDAPAAASVSIAPTASSLAARCSGVCPFEPRADTDAPAATSPSIINPNVMRHLAAAGHMQCCHPELHLHRHQVFKRRAWCHHTIAAISWIAATFSLGAAAAPPVITRSRMALDMLSPIQRAGKD